MNEKTFTAVVKVEFVDGGTNVNILQPDEQNLTTDDLGKILAGGLALCIRGSENEVEYMKEIIDYLNSEFVNSNSFSDIKKRV